MNVEIIAVGSELLLGQINNTNARFLSAQLNEIGENVRFHTVVGDNGQRLKETIRQAERRSDCIILTGGLGPTKDDLTKEVIAEHLNRSLIMDEEAMQSIETFFAVRNRPMTENNKKQALVLEGSTIFKNRHGMAPGMGIELNGKQYILLPGPPKEMEPMFQFEVKPYLLQMQRTEQTIVSRVLRFYGIGEAALEQRVAPFLDMENPTVAPLAADGEVTLRVTASAHTEQQAQQLMEPVIAQLLERVGNYLYGYDDDSLASKLAEVLRNNKLTIAAAESLTAGLFMSELASIPGISDVLQGGAVVYNEQMKVKQLQIDRQLLRDYTVVSSQCAEAMARNVALNYDAKIGVGLTGAAGPDPHDGSPVGTVWIGICIDGICTSFELKLAGSRNANRLVAVKNAQYRTLQLLAEKGYN
ncbi:competence/damage-inducible protein A [Kurthia senegalensis]|uniref:competence/damage-inducible protein A n=1 Tax=Kurthia senegalensis TaxID=1033740 RepID=UPI000288886A|nr:competence/damage-inducible protein A [Kurthia senegalensis]